MLKEAGLNLVSPKLYTEGKLKADLGYSDPLLRKFSERNPDQSGFLPY